MSADERQRALRTFRTERGVRVLLLSLKAGGTGLNLTAAQRVFLLDPWWNPAVEQQAFNTTQAPHATCHESRVTSHTPHTTHRTPRTTHLRLRTAS